VLIICDRGGKVADRLGVDTGGLSSAATSSEAIADALTTTSFDSGAFCSQPSHAGVRAVDNAMSSVRNRQSTRVSEQAGHMTAGGGRYNETDGGAAEDFAVLT
jgi:hypothetical protein